MGCLDDDVMDYIDEALGISVGLQDSSETAQERTADEPNDDVPDEMVLTLCGTCLKQFIYSPEHIVRRIDRTQTKEPCMYCHVRLYVLPCPGRLRLPHHPQEKAPGRRQVLRGCGA